MKDNKKEKRITIRISEDEYNKILIKAHNSDMSVSEYFRFAASRSEKGKLKKGNIVCPDCYTVYPSYFPYCGNCGHFFKL